MYVHGLSIRESVGVHRIQHTLNVAVLLLVGRLQFIVGSSTFILVLAERGRTGVFQFLDLRIVSHIVVL